MIGKGQNCMEKNRGKKQAVFFFLSFLAIANFLYNEGQASSWLSYAFVLGVFTALLDDLQSTGL